MFGPKKTGLSLARFVLYSILGHDRGTDQQILCAQFVAVMQILRKLEALTLQYVSYKVLPAPEMLANLTQLSIPAGAESFFKGAITE